MIQISLLVIRTKYPAELARFYEKLGVHFCYHQHGNGPFHYSAELGNLVFEIYPFMKNQTESDHSTRLGFIVNDLDQLLSELSALKVVIASEPQLSEYGYVAVIQDLDGRKIELKERSSVET